MTFVGEWLCQFYNLLEKRFPDGGVVMPARTIFPPAPFPFTVRETPQQRLEGYFPNPPGPGFGGVYGNLSADGRVWQGTFFPAPEPIGLVGGLFTFVLDESGDTFHGAWTGIAADGTYPGGAPEPWWGTRVS